jgi:hypothetical protein
MRDGWEEYGAGLAWGDKFVMRLDRAMGAEI